MSVRVACGRGCWVVVLRRHSGLSSFLRVASIVLGTYSLHSMKEELKSTDPGRAGYRSKVLGSIPTSSVVQKYIKHFPRGPFEVEMVPCNYRGMMARV